MEHDPEAERQANENLDLEKENETLMKEIDRLNAGIRKAGGMCRNEFLNKGVIYEFLGILYTTSIDKRSKL